MKSLNASLGHAITVIRALLLLCAFSAGAFAHPVAQGSMEMEIRPGEIRAMVRVSNEQIIVQTANAKEESPDIQSAWRAHGSYLLAKMEVTADGRLLSGTMEKLEMPADRSVRGFTIYQLRYPIESVPRELRLRQSLLNEISFAPGNVWEATLVLQMREGTRVIREGALFTHREPVVIEIASTGSPAAGVFGEYFRHGFHHILEGWDHLLFVAALVLGARSVWQLVMVVTVFTLAHTLTLALSAYDVVRLSPGIVEPMIALSIIVAALQNVVRPASTQGALRLALVFAFGLFHGLGFAGGLLEAMQAGGRLLMPLTAFSIGVEVGHQVVVIPLFLALLFVRTRFANEGSRERFSLRTVRAGSVFIALAGCFYFASALKG